MRLVGLTVGDDPDAWRALGFTVDRDRFTVGGVTIHLVGAHGERGILGWSLDPPLAGAVDGLAHLSTAAPVEQAVHANGVTHVDHVVAGTPDVRRTIAALGEVGLQPRRVVEGVREADRTYAFLLLGTCILEVIGPTRHDSEGTPRPAVFAGLAFVAPDLGAVATLDGMAGEPKPAIQPGRSIVTLRTQQAGVSVPVAVLTPR